MFFNEITNDNRSFYGGCSVCESSLAGASPKADNQTREAKSRGGAITPHDKAIPQADENSHVEQLPARKGKVK